MPAAANHQNGHIISFRELQDILLVSALKIAQHFQKPIFTSTFHSPRFMIQHFENSEKKRAALGYILQPFFFSCPCCAFFTSLGSFQDLALICLGLKITKNVSKFFGNAKIQNSVTMQSIHQYLLLSYQYNISALI